MNKPKCVIIGKNGNIFNLGGIASRALEAAGLNEKAKEMRKKIVKAKSYDEALCIIMDFVDVE